MTIPVINGNRDTNPNVNLCINGSFIIDQRGLTLGHRVIGDYVADMWKVHTSTTVDYLQTTFIGNGVRLEGTGRKGQVVTLMNVNLSVLPRALLRPGLLPAEQEKTPLTAFVNAFSQLHTRVRIRATPRRGVGAPVFEKYKDGKPTFDRPYTQAVGLLTSLPFGITEGAKIDVILEEDGDFNVIIFNFSEIPGLYMDPSPYAIVDRSTELEGCKGYYDSGHSFGFIPIYNNAGSQLNAYYHIKYNKQMKLGQSVSISSITLSPFQTAELGSGITSGDQANWTVNPQTLLESGFSVLFTRSVLIANRSFLSVEFNWLSQIL